MGDSEASGNSHAKKRKREEEDRIVSYKRDIIIPYRHFEEGSRTMEKFIVRPVGNPKSICLEPWRGADNVRIMPTPNDIIE